MELPQNTHLNMGIKSSRLSPISPQFAFQNHCEASSIPYIQAQAFYPTFQEECPRLLLEHPIYDHIKENHFIGWPIYKEVGGFSLSDKIGNNLRVNWPIDMHPNQEGHELIANVFYNRYQELYDD